MVSGKGRTEMGRLRTLMQFQRVPGNIFFSIYTKLKEAVLSEVVSENSPAKQGLNRCLGPTGKCPLYCLSELRSRRKRYFQYQAARQSLLPINFQPRTSSLTTLLQIRRKKKWKVVYPWTHSVNAFCKYVLYAANNKQTRRNPRQISCSTTFT